MRHTISVFVENKFGVLARIAGLFSARGFNIDSLSVGETIDPTVSRMTIVSKGDDQIIEQVIKQLRRLIEVIKVIDLTQTDFVEREMVIDAVIRNLEVIGEAATNIPEAIRIQYPAIPWKRMIGLRNIVIHGYFGIDLGIIWEIITRNLPDTKPLLVALLKKIK